MLPLPGVDSHGRVLDEKTSDEVFGFSGNVFPQGPVQRDDAELDGVGQVVLADLALPATIPAAVSTVLPAASF